MRLILASGSPRRAALLAAAGFDFEIRPQRVDERLLPGEDPPAYVMRVAEAKAAAAECREVGTVVLAADTTVVIDGVVLGKPADDREAADMLNRLSGRTHEVLTAVVVRGDSRTLAELERTAVRLLPLSEEDIAWYVATGEPRDKAGAYAIQGLASRFVDRIEGSCSNVVGLPMATVWRLLSAVNAV